MDQRANILATERTGNGCPVTEDGNRDINQAIGTIVSEGDAIGAVLILSDDTKKKFGEFEEKMALCGANFLGRQMES
jgi:AbrB family transcriptional regulator (stage V sporulation protein T)